MSEIRIVECLRVAALLVAALAGGCGGDSEREVPICRNAWREIRIPEEFSDFQAATSLWHEGRLYLFKGVLVEPVIDPFPDQPIGLVFEPPDTFRPISSEGALELLPGIDLILPIGNELLMAGQAMYDPGWVTRYDTIDDRWLDAHSSDAPVGSRHETVAPMGEELLKVIEQLDENSERVRLDYFAYGLASGWRPLEPPPVPDLWVRGVWTGQETILWGLPNGAADGHAPAIRFDPARDAWLDLAAPHPAALANGASGVWTGEELIVGNARYYPSRDAWEPVSQLRAAFGVPTAVGRRVVNWYMGWPELTDVSGAVYDAELDRWGPPITTRCLGRPSTGWHQTWIDDGLVLWMWYGEETPDRFVLLPAEAVFGELPEDPDGCSCPPPLGED